MIQTTKLNKCCLLLHRSLDCEAEYDTNYKAATPWQVLILNHQPQPELLWRCLFHYFLEILFKFPGPDNP